MYSNNYPTNSQPVYYANISSNSKDNNKSSDLNNSTSSNFSTIENSTNYNSQNNDTQTPFEEDLTLRNNEILRNLWENIFSNITSFVYRSNSEIMVTSERGIRDFAIGIINSNIRLIEIYKDKHK